MNIKRGNIYYADLDPVVGSDQGGVRPVLIIQNDIGNKLSPSVICAAITSKKGIAKLPTHVGIGTLKGKLKSESVVLLEQVRTIDKSRIRDKVCCLGELIMGAVDSALLVSLGMNK